MNAIRPAEDKEKRVTRVEPPSTFDPYPLLGLILAVVLAILTYGGLFFFLF